MVFTDSKKIYSTARGLGWLEENVLTAIAPTPFFGGQTSTWQHVCGRCWQTSSSDAVATPWFDDYDEPLPVAASPKRLDKLRTKYGASITLQRSGMHFHLTNISARALPAIEFNHLLDSMDNKATLLSQTSLALCRQLVDTSLQSSIAPRRVVVICDKHGGRNQYSQLLAGAFSTTLVSVIRESSQLSEYRMQYGSTEIDICFACRGEAYFPTALASMTAKYIRELAMRAFNRYWGECVEGLKPTAGYGPDAKRFRIDIAHAQKELSVPDSSLWRRR